MLDCIAYGLRQIRRMRHDRNLFVPSPTSASTVGRLCSLRARCWAVWAAITMLHKGCLFSVHAQSEVSGGPQVMQKIQACAGLYGR
jgi:hypothetical protein